MIEDDEVEVDFADVFSPAHPRAAQKPKLPSDYPLERVKSDDGRAYVTLRSFQASIGKFQLTRIKEIERFVEYLIVKDKRGKRRRSCPCLPESDLDFIYAIANSKPNRSKQVGCIYFIQHRMLYGLRTIYPSLGCLLEQEDEKGPIKIGWTIHPIKRILDLQVGNPFKYIFLGALANQTIEDEQRLLVEFAEFCIQGEWFHREPLLTHIATLPLETKPFNYKDHGWTMSGGQSVRALRRLRRVK
jgi:hypothetical protein